MTSVQCEARDLTFRSEHLYKNWTGPAIIEEQNIGGKRCDKLLHTEMCWDLQKKLKEVSVRENEEQNSEKTPDNMLGDKGIKTHCSKVWWWQKLEILRSTSGYPGRLSSSCEGQFFFRLLKP